MRLRPRPVPDRVPLLPLKDEALLFADPAQRRTSDDLRNPAAQLGPRHTLVGLNRDRPIADRIDDDVVIGTGGDCAHAGASV
jgi:hypothetical protein